jgi:hypothetical protein
MSSSQESGEDGSAAATSATRRPYSPPRIEESGRFDQLVLMCAHTPSLPNCNPTRTFPTRTPQSL